MRRGDVVLVDLGEPRGAEAGHRRPAVIVSNDAAYAAVERRGRGTVTVVPITSNVRRILSFHVALEAGAGGLQRESKAQAEQIRTVSAGRLGARLGELPKATMHRLDAALRLHLAV
jgi:mRNA interferase MazF